MTAARRSEGKVAREVPCQREGPQLREPSMSFAALSAKRSAAAGQYRPNIPRNFATISSGTVLS